MINARLEELRTKFQENPRRYFAPFANELRKAADYAQAIAICRTHLAGQPGHVSGHIVLGQALYEAGETNESRDTFATALELDPENLIALRTMGEISQVNGDFSMARHWYERLLDADPRNSEVAQLLKDIPAEPSAREPSSFAPPIATAAPVAAEVPVADAEPEEVTPPPAPGFHTAFTGAVPAYVPREESDESPPAASMDEMIDIAAAPEPVSASVDEMPAVDSEPVSAADDELPSMASAPVDEAPIAPDGMVDLDMDSFQSGAPEEALPAAPLPDEAPATAAMEMDFGAAEEPFAEYAPAAEPEAIVEQEQQAALTEAESDFVVESDQSSFEPPRALFAEHGFEGSVDDQVGWITPSAAYSDPEAAPETWFDEPESADDAQAAADVEERPGTEMSSESEPASDSWFDDVESAAATEPADTGSEELWMPDFSGAVGGESPVSAGEEPVAAPEPMPQVEAYEETVPMVAASAQVPDESEPPQVEVAAMAEGGDDALMIEHPPAAETGHEWIEAEGVAQDAEVREPEMVHDDQAIAETALVSAPDEAIAEPEYAPYAAEAAAAFVDAAEPEAVEAVGAAEAEAPLPEQPAQAETPEEFVGAATAEYPDPAVGHTPSFTAAIPSSTPAQEPFVTETLAELYLQQGFREEALAIYRQLAGRDPSDQSLRHRIEAIERGAASDVMQAADASEPPRRSPSVRSFFSKLAQRAPAPAGSVTPTPPASAPVQETPFAAAASALANLFAASRPAPADEGAASTLASAFTDPAGRPSRAAERELSLDHLFRDVPPGQGPGTSGVMLDEFYAAPPSAQPDSPTPSGEGAAAPPDEGGTDIRQFTAWLEGLRKK